MATLKEFIDYYNNLESDNDKHEIHKILCVRARILTLLEYASRFSHKRKYSFFFRYDLFQYFFQKKDEIFSTKNTPDMQFLVENTNVGLMLRGFKWNSHEDLINFLISSRNDQVKKLLDWERKHVSFLFYEYFVYYPYLIYRVCFLNKAFNDQNDLSSPFPTFLNGIVLVIDLFFLYTQAQYGLFQFLVKLFSLSVLRLYLNRPQYDNENARLVSLEKYKHFFFIVLFGMAEDYLLGTYSYCAAVVLRFMLSQTLLKTFSALSAGFSVMNLFPLRLSFFLLELIGGMYLGHLAWCVDKNLQDCLAAVEEFEKKAPSYGLWSPEMHCETTVWNPWLWCSQKVKTHLSWGENEYHCSSVCFFSTNLQSKSLSFDLTCDEATCSLFTP